MDAQTEPASFPNAPAETIAPAPADEPPKRGRGRPKGAKNKPKGDAAVGSETPVAQVNAGGAPSDPLGGTGASTAGGGVSDAPPKPPGKKDRPKAERKPTRAATTARTREIQKALAQILVMPSIPFALRGDQFCAQHFQDQGPALALTLAEASERNKPLRDVLERFVEGESIAVLFMGLTMYALPPLLYHGVIPSSEVIRPLMGVPEKGAPEPEPEVPWEETPGAPLDPSALGFAGYGGPIE